MKVLVPIDSSSASETVISEIAGRVWPAGASFRVVHVQLMDMPGLERFAALSELQDKEARDLVSSAAAKLKKAGLLVSTEVLAGSPRREITRYAKEYGAELIMLGTHGQGALSRLFLGSVAQAVMRTAHCSVEVVRPRTRGTGGSVRAMRILLATDGSEGGKAAVKSLACRPWPGGTEIKIISTVELVTPGAEMGAASSAGIYPFSLLEELWDEARVHAREAVQEATKIVEAAGMKVIDGAETPEGDPRFVLVEQAKQWGADLIVLGSHGRHGFDRMLMGSVSESVAFHAPCSVEVVRQQCAEDIAKP